MHFCVCVCVCVHLCEFVCVLSEVIPFSLHRHTHTQKGREEVCDGEKRDKWIKGARRQSDGKRETVTGKSR